MAFGCAWPVRLCRANAAKFADGVIDFEAVLRNPADPASMLPAFDSGDHLHPNDTGYRAMAAAVVLGLLM